MSKALDATRSFYRERIGAIWCDSKACAVYTLQIGVEHHQLSYPILDAFAAAVIWTDEGFNGMYVEDLSDAYLDPDWGPDDDGRPHYDGPSRAHLRWKYEAYLKTQLWADRRVLVIARCKGRCEGCGRTRAQAVHHLSYAHLGNEPLAELRALCRRCHQIVHNPTLLGRFSAADSARARAADPEFLKTIADREQ